MKHKLPVLGLALLGFLTVIATATPGTYTNPVGDVPIHMGDPFAFWHEGKYYLIGTTAPNEGFHCYESTDLTHWQLKGWAWRKPADAWAVGAFWAPEVKFYQGKFYLTYSGLVRDSKPNKLLMGLAVSDTPAGPYRDLHAPWFDPGYSTIDGHLFVDDDGTPYLFFSRNGSQDGYSFGINYGVQLERDLSKPVGTPVQLLEASQPWERVKWAENRCNEGATVLKHNGKYYLTYSANHTAFPDYGVGYATAEKPLGPWTKAEENPILATHPELGVSAPGHNSIVRSPDGKELFIVYHTHADPLQPSQDRVVNIDRLEFASDGKLRVKGPTRSPQPLPSGVAADVAGLRCEFMKTPLGIDDARPALSWTIRDERRGVVQTAYRVLVASSEELLAQGKGDLWDSGEVASDCSHLVTYAGKPLVSRQRCFWKVLVKTMAAGCQQNSSAWSPVSWWEMGLLKPSDWQGSWIQSAACQPMDDETTRLWTRQALIPQELNNPAIKINPKSVEATRAEGLRLMGSLLPAPVFRNTFEVAGTVKQARLYVSGLGFSEAFVNGAAISDRMFDPSVNCYQGRGGYVTYDITSLVRRGKNVVTATVGGGWWHETIIWGSPDKFMGLPSLRAQIEVELTDGMKTIVPTSATWTTAVGPILKTHYYAGEVYDARRAPGWKSGADDGLPWVAATEVKAPVPVLEAQRCEPERVIQRVKPVSVAQPRPSIWVFDLGQMCMGTVELNIKAPAGTTITMRTAEWTWHPSQQGPDFKTSLLHYDEGDNSVRTEGMIVGKPRGSTYFSWNYKPKGVPGIRNVHLGVPTLVYVARGDAAGETWHPGFTTHPFRYIEVQGLKEAPTLDLVTGLMISSDEEVVGSFTSTNPRFNDIFEAGMNSTRFTTHGMAWDNATERLQSQVLNAWSAPFASCILWYPNFWRKVMEDLRLVNVLAPENKRTFGTVIYGSRGAATPPGNPVTQGVTVELPMQYYDRYGDRRELEKQYPHMKTWCETFFPNKDGKIIEKATMGAWLDHFCNETSDDSLWRPDWDPRAMMSMMLYSYVRDTADVARILGKIEDATSLEKLARAIRSEVNRVWYNATNKTYSAARSRADKAVDASRGWHGMMAMAVAKGLAPEADVPKLLDNCIADMQVHYNSHHAAGHITHQLLYDVYSDHGLIETCYDMMNATGFPSFTWMLQSGNRTIPEGPTWTNALPAKASAYQNECQEPARWFTQTLCGVAPDRAKPGFKHILLHPHIPSRLSSASLVTTTPYGELESSWQQKAGSVTWTVRIPANSHATAWLPAKNAEDVREGMVPLKDSPGCRVQKVSTDGVECRLGSGVFQFRFPAPANTPSRLSELK